MRIGLSPDVVRSAGSLVELARRAEGEGFDSLWAPDHLAFYGSPVIDPFQALAALAAGSTTLALGTSVLVLPLRAPARAAKEAASLDVLSEGRVVLGVGVGGEFPGEYEASGVPLGERGRRMDEALAVLRHLWSGSGEPFAGRFSSIPAGTRLDPLPLRPGGPPIWIGGREEPALRRAARAGEGYLGFLLDAPGFSRRMTRIRALAREAGQTPRPVVGACVTFAHVGPDVASAARSVATHLEANYRAPMQTAVERYGLVGPRAACVERALELREAGVEHLVLASPLRGQEFDAQMKELARLRHAL